MKRIGLLILGVMAVSTGALARSVGARRRRSSPEPRNPRLTRPCSPPLPT